MKKTYTPLFYAFMLLFGSLKSFGQQNWNIVTSSSSASAAYYLDITNSAPNVWHACGNKGSMLRSDNYGQTWTSTTTGIGSNTVQLNTVDFSSDKIGFAGGITTTLQFANYGKLYFTIDAGESWTEYNTGSSLPGVNSIHFPSVYRGYAVAGNKVLRTTSGGNDWTYNYTYGSIDLYDIHFPDSLIGFACGELGSIIRTKNGGDNWQTVYSDPDNTDLYSIYFVNKNTGFACGDNGILLRTVNGGDDWVKYSTSITSDLNSISFFNSSEGLIVGQGGDILYTDNGGGSFSYLATPISNTLTRVHITSSNQAIAVGVKETILKYGSLGLGVETVYPMDENTIRVYPNPATTEVTVEWLQNTQSTTYLISIYDMTGKLLYQQNQASQDAKATVPTADFEAGVYTLKILADGQLHTRRFIKQ